MVIADPAPSLAVTCRNVSKAFGRGVGRTRALANINFDAYSGEMTYIVGPSGCGKTTLISAIAGILRPDGGAIEVFGTAVNAISTSASARYRRVNIGFVLQQFHLFPALTVSENVAVPLVLNGTARPAARERVDELLDAVGLNGQSEKFPEELSVGQQQRVAVARALANGPRLLICDEPTAALDAASSDAVIGLLRSVALGPGRAVIVVTHDPRVLEHADRVVEMRDGRVSVATGAPEGSVV